MNKELFGVFGDRAAFDGHTEDRRFDAVLGGSEITVGIRDPDLGRHGRSAVAESDDGICAVWGESFTPDGVAAGTAEWLLDRVARRGRRGLDGLNGSYIAVVDCGDTAVVATDQARTWECFYSDAPDETTFGSDAAAVAATIPFPGFRRQGLLEFFHLGVVLGDGTLLEDLRRVPFDGVISPDGPDSLDRFVYAPEEFDTTAELTDRVRRAFDRRQYEGRRSGLLLSAGFDSRTFLSMIDSIDQCYTVGDAGALEAQQAGSLATGYGALHTVFPPDGRYLAPDEEKVRHSHGIRESLHIHHAGYDNYIDTDVVYHGLLFDTFLRDYFVPRSSVSVFDREIPLDRLEPDPDPVDALLGSIPYSMEGSRAFVDETRLGPEDPDAFVREAIARELERYEERADGVENLIAVTGIANQPSLSFRAHLADNHCESFVAADLELLEWHLRAPPAERTLSTFLDVCRRVDPSLLDIRPPDRRFDSGSLSTIDSFARQLLPGVDSPGNAWPDREELADRHGLQEELFPLRPNLRTLRARHALRINDAHGWVNQAVETDVDPEDLLGAAT